MRFQFLGPVLTLVLVALVTCACSPPDLSDEADVYSPADAESLDAGAGDTLEPQPDIHYQDSGALQDGQQNDVTDDITTISDADILYDDEDSTPNDAAISLDSTETGDAGVVLPQPCSPTLKLLPKNTKILTYDLLTFVASGGSGAHRFELIANNSGAIINKYTGAYLSGDKAGVSDTLRLSDMNCAGEALATVEVVNAMVVKPLGAQVDFGQKMTLQVDNGSGQFGFKILKNASGSTITATGLYTAGNKAGEDQVEVTDQVTGEVVNALVFVQQSASIKALPANLVLPLGGSGRVEIDGGSGHFVVSAPGKVVSISEGEKITANQTGTVVATVKDAFTNKSIKVTMTVVTAHENVGLPTGDGLVTSHARLVPDLNGDGLPEVVLSRAEADIAANNSGAVYLYTSKNKSLNSTPTQILTGITRDS
ncbi:MAG TPA: hypothetical protein DCQ06_00155, partial [Myxococcales bacterium]|nr:hypothetical protein [Myxococcales bacterium]